MIEQLTFKLESKTLKKEKTKSTSYSILKKSVLADGTDIQIEDWTKCYSFIKTQNVACYPIAKESGHKKYWDYPVRGEKFRLNISKFSDNNEVEDIFNKLVQGSISIKDLASRFYNEEEMNYI